MIKSSLILGFIFSLCYISKVDAADPQQANKAYQAGDYAKAEQLYRAAINSQPENAKLYFNLGNTLSKLGRADEAIQAYTQYLALAETPVEKALGEYNIGTVLAKDDNWKQAAKHFKRSLFLNPDDEDAKYNYELALKRQKEQEQKQQQQQNQPPPEPSAYAKEMKKRAEVLVDQKRYQEAYSLMQEALQTDRTVAAYNDFIKRINDIIKINQN